MERITLEVADESHIRELLPLVRAYHEFENLVISDMERTKAVLPLLTVNSSFGRIWLISYSGAVIGYIAKHGLYMHS